MIQDNGFCAYIESKIILSGCYEKDYRTCLLFYSDWHADHVDHPQSSGGPDYHCSVIVFGI